MSNRLSAGCTLASADHPQGDNATEHFSIPISRPQRSLVSTHTPPSIARANLVQHQHSYPRPSASSNPLDPLGPADRQLPPFHWQYQEACRPCLSLPKTRHYLRSTTASPPQRLDWWTSRAESTSETHWLQLRSSSALIVAFSDWRDFESSTAPPSFTPSHLPSTCTVEVLYSPGTFLACGDVGWNLCVLVKL